jgi:SAM-dependent methyltransferase
MHELERHYSDGGLMHRVRRALEAEGKGLDALSINDLSSVDEFHTRGRHATRELAELAALETGRRVLDVGSGLGGPARFVASRFECDVTGVDRVAEFCEVAEELTRLTGLGDRVRFRCADALALPFDDASFEVVWTMQAQMNVADKRGFYREIARVLEPGGRFVFQDICAGNGEPLELPVPWASHASQSHLIRADALHALLSDLGFEERAWRDVSETIIAWRAAHPLPADPRPLDTHLIMGERAAEKQRNSGANLRAGRIAFVQGVFERRPG